MAEVGRHNKKRLAHAFQAQPSSPTSHVPLGSHSPIFLQQSSSWSPIKKIKSRLLERSTPLLSQPQRKSGAAFGLHFPGFPALKNGQLDSRNEQLTNKTNQTVQYRRLIPLKPLHFAAAHNKPRKTETMTTATTRPAIATYDHQTREGLDNLAHEALRQATSRGIINRAGDIYAQAIEDVNKHVSKTNSSLNRKRGYKPADVIRQATGHVFEQDAAVHRHERNHPHTSEPLTLSALLSHDPGQYLIDKYTRMFDVYTTISEATDCGRMLATIDRRAIAATKPPTITLKQPGLRWQPPTPANPAPLAEPTRRAIDRRNQQTRPQLASA